MAIRCVLKYRTRVGNLVSKSERKTKRLYKNNCHIMTLYSFILNTNIRLYCNMKIFRTIMSYGGIDGYLNLNSNRNIPDEMMAIKKMIINK